MFTLIAILLFIIIALVFGIIFAVVGWRGGLYSGIRVFAFSVISVLLAFFISPLISRAVYHSELLDQTVISVTDKAAAMGISGLTFDRVIGATIQRYLNMVIAPVLFLLILVILSIIWRIIKAYIYRKKEQEPIKMKTQGLLLGIAGAIFITLFSIFAPKINLIKEAGRVTYLYQEAKPVIAGNADYKKLVSDAPKLVEHYFNTQLIAASEEDRLNLLYKTMVHLTQQEKYNAMSGIAASLRYTDRAAFEIEIYSAVNAINSFGEDFVNCMLKGDTAKAVANIPDISTAVNNLYTLNMYDGVVQAIMTLILRDVSEDNTYIYPKTIEISGTQASFTQLLEAIPGLTGDRAEALRNFNKLKNSPLLPPEVFYRIIDLLRN